MHVCVLVLREGPRHLLQPALACSDLRIISLGESHLLQKEILFERGLLLVWTILFSTFHGIGIGGFDSRHLTELKHLFGGVNGVSRKDEENGDGKERYFCWGYDGGSDF